MTVLLQSDRAQGTASTIALFGLSGFILLLPFGRLSELGVFLCLISSTIFLFAARKRHGRFSFLRSLAPALSAALTCWALIIAAALISCLDSTERSGSFQTTFASMRFAALIIAAAQLTSAQRVFVGKLVGITLGVWCLDALLQAASGLSLGGKSNADRISGIFGDDNLKLGLTIATLAPVALYAALKFDPVWARDKHRFFYLAAVWFVIAAAVLLGGARAGWVMFAIASVLWGLRISGYQWQKTGLGLLIACTAALGLAAVLNASNSQFALRVERTMAIFDAQTADFALAGRVPIWQTAVRMALAHPVNGVGVRAFRYAYPEFAQANDPWVRPASPENAANTRAIGASHPHQLFLEILTETGLVGLVLWGLAGLVLVRAWRQAHSANRAQAWPYGCALLVLLFPINTHTAMYSSFWAGVLWWLVAMLSAELGGAEKAEV